MTKPETIPTGVPGLDHVLMGGFIRGGFYLVQGDPGSGKNNRGSAVRAQPRQSGVSPVSISP